jgi:NAD(P)-dependent dehydrogenase (short-subunit alcohol dehydrogenase family)
VVSPLGGGLGIDPPAPRSAPAHGTNGDLDVVPHGAGARGLVKTAALEFAERQVRLVDLDPATDPAELARIVADEVLQEGAPVEVGWRDGRRRMPVVATRPPVATSGSGSAAGTNGHSGQNGHDSHLPLSPGSVVLLTGGGRGITARSAVALAQRYRCHVELVGRTAFPQGEEPPEIAAAPDRMALRAALIRAGGRTPKEIERECDRILAEREIRQHHDALVAAGVQVVYHQVDVRDAAGLTAVVTSIYERHGRLDGIVHGAGMLDDHLVADKAPEAFERVFATKVDAARTLLDAVHHATTSNGSRPKPAFVAFFGSIAGVCGNRGQIDYAAANDALDTIAAANPEAATRVFAIDWGPWSPDVGMVSDSLAQLFEESGMGLIQLDDGLGVLLDEVAAAAATEAGAGDRTRPHQVVAVRCSPELMALSLTHGKAPVAPPARIADGV